MLFRSFLAFYRGRDWDKAVSLAKDLANHMNFLQDYYEMMIERIGELKADDPGEGWDGVYRATSK